MDTAAMPTKDLKALLTERAKVTAAGFVAEFGEPLNPDETDWDGTAWEDDGRDIDTDLIDWAFPFYQQALVSETQRLCSRDDAPNGSIAAEAKLSRNCTDRE